MQLIIYTFYMIDETKPTAGRPTKFKEEFIELAFNYCLLGATDNQLADFFEVDQDTINRWKKKHPKFYESIKEAKSQADSKVVRSLYERANGYTHPEEKVFNNNGEIVTHETLKHYPPDPTAMIFWLKNRQPEKFRDKQEIEHSGEVKIVDDID